MVLAPAYGALALITGRGVREPLRQLISNNEDIIRLREMKWRLRRQGKTELRVVVNMKWMTEDLPDEDTESDKEDEDVSRRRQSKGRKRQPRTSQISVSQRQRNEQQRERDIAAVVGDVIFEIQG